MAKVPYSPVPSVGPTGGDLPGMNASVPIEAFGGASAQAFSRAGATLENVGDEIFKRAMALQQLDNEAEAKEADVAYTLEAGRRHAEFSSLSGRAAKDAFPEYEAGLKTLRTETTEGLSNPTSRRMFDTSATSTMVRTILSSQGHVASENKKYLIGASTARVESFGDQALSMPLDEEGFQENIAKATNEIVEQAGILGQGPDWTVQEINTKTSDLWSKRITGLAKSNPFAASKMLDQATNDGVIIGEDLTKTSNVVRQQMYTVGARNVSSQTRSGEAGLYAKSIPPMPAAKHAMGTLESGGDYTAQGPEVFKKDGTSRGRALGKYQVMPENLPAWLAQAGLPSMSPKEFLDSPKAQETVFETIFGGYMKQYGNFDDAVSKWHSGVTAVEAAEEGRTDGYLDTVSYIKKANEYLAKNAPLGDLVDRAKAEAETLMPNDPLFGDYVAQRVTADYNLEAAVRRNDEFNDGNTALAAVNNGINNKLPTSVEDLEADPEAYAAYQRLPETKKAAVRRGLVLNSKDDVPQTEKAFKRYQEIKGQFAEYNSFDTDKRIELLNLDVMSEDLPRAWRGQLLDIQRKANAGGEADPRVGKGLQVMRPDLHAAGIDKSIDPAQYYRYVGAYEDAMSTWMESNKKPPNNDEMREIGRQLLQEQYDPSETAWFGMERTTQMFDQDVPTDILDEIRLDPQWQTLGVVPTDEQIQRVYTGRLYQKLYGKPKVQPK